VKGVQKYSVHTSETARVPHINNTTDSFKVQLHAQNVNNILFPSLRWLFYAQAQKPACIEKNEVLLNITIHSLH